MRACQLPAAAVARWSASERAPNSLPSGFKWCQVRVKRRTKETVETTPSLSRLDMNHFPF